VSRFFFFFVVVVEAVSFPDAFFGSDALQRDFRCTTFDPIRDVRVLVLYAQAFLI